MTQKQIQPKNVLLTFIGDRDPFNPRDDTEGPILSLLGVRREEKPCDFPEFSEIELFFTAEDGRNEKAEQTKKEIEKRYKNINCRIHKLPIDDPTDYGQILSALREKLSMLQKEKENSKRQFFINVAPGTPQMHASWMILVALGEIRGKVFYTPNPTMLKPGDQRIRWIDPFKLGSPFIGKAAMPGGKVNISDEELSDIWNEIGIRSNSPKVKEVYSEALKAAHTDIPIVIYGETGSGKELLARFIHKVSSRKGKRFVPLNCSTLSLNLVESELFGHVKGAFTDAKSDKQGLFEAAHEGTLFMDEVATLPLDFQAKLLRTLENKEIRRVGGNDPIYVDVRIVSATNEDLRLKVKRGEFREDLYYRLVGAVLTLPPLRERLEDIPLLVHQLMAGRDFTEDAINTLLEYDWPGNVRELKTILQTCDLIADSVIERKHVEEAIKRISLKN